jgi:two-component system, chemotaxis family, chemotaxis protein CheY
MGLRIVLVDDSVFMRSMLKKIVTENRAEVVGEAGDGGEALIKYQELHPDLVFMDIMMPNIDGIEGLKRIIGFDKNARIVMCTSIGQEKVVTEAVEAGASDFVVKPFTPQDIKTIIEKYSPALA